MSLKLTNGMQRFISFKTQPTYLKKKKKNYMLPLSPSPSPLPLPSYLVVEKTGY